MENYSTMPLRQKAQTIIFSICISSGLFAQAHNVSEGYVKPTDPMVIQNLEQWQDLKFGLFMHWEPIVSGALLKAGAYAQKMNPGRRENLNMGNHTMNM